MLQPTLGFIPPAAPLVAPALNGIVGTGGLLAGAAAGARVGAVLGPKGALAGALVGGLVVPLLFPSPTAPGTLPGLEPGLNPGKRPEPETKYPSGVLEAGDPLETGGLQFFNGQYTRCKTERENYQCKDGPDGGTWVSPASCFSPSFWIFNGRSVKIEQKSYESGVACGSTDYFDDFVIRITGIKEDGTEELIRQEIVRNGTWYNGVGFVGKQSTTYVKITSFTMNGDDIDLGQQEPETGTLPEKPRKQPIPFTPLTTDPTKSPEPGPVPQPEPEPQPPPLEVPSPESPDAPPITIPKAPPGGPQPVPGPGPDPNPFPTPTIAPPIAPPLPIPKVPTVPEPTPDPNPVPAPGPTPIPSPDPFPRPRPNPEPEPSPLPLPGEAPKPISPQTPEKPDDTDDTSPDGNLVPTPTPPPVKTPTDTHFPIPGGPGVTPGGTRQDIAAIAAEVGRIEQKTASLQSNQKDIPWLLIGPILEALAALLEQDIPGTTYQLQGICETTDENGEQPVAEFAVEPAKNLGAIINRLDTIDQMLQQHLAWKTPTCSERPTLQGDWRTISFISDEVSPYGSARLRKRFRYRSTSSLGLGEVIDHWKDFVWSAGPVCIQHAGSSWGTPQCWASSVDEGKRVIRHAAGEAGFDPDKNGRWVVSGSDSARVGVSGTMRVNRKGGYYWITSRDGSEGRPLVGTVDTSP